MANRTRNQLSTDSLGYFPNNNSQLISPQDLRDWITNGIESFVTQKDTSRFENAFYENRSTALASGATVNLSSANGNFVHITGTTNISSFGSASEGSRFILCFDGVLTLTYNATSLILPGTANITTAAGDCCLIISEGSSNWRVVAYFPISGGGGGGSGTVTSISTSSPITGGPITTTGTIGIQDAVADGSTKGAASFNASDFNSASGVISIDYANGQKASGSQDGFLSSTDWTTFNGKQSAGNYITDLTNDITASGPGSAVATIANDAVTYAKIQNVSTNNRLLGRATAGAGDVEEITLGTGLTLSGTTLNASGGGSGTVNSGTANRLTYYAATGTAVSELPTAGSSGQILQSNGTGSAPSWVNAPAATLTLGSSIVGGATAGRLLLTTTSGANQVLNQDSNLNYDTTNDRLGIGVASPAARLDLAAPVAANPSLILAPSSGVTPTGTTNGSIWCDTTSSNTSLTMRKDSAYTKILTLDRNPDLAVGSASGVVISDVNGSLTKSADLTALGIYAQSNQVSVSATTDTTLLGTLAGSSTLPANFFGVGKTITIFVSGLYSQANSSQTCTISLKIGATTLTNTLSFTHNSTLTNVYWEAAFVLTCRTAGASGVIAYQGKGMVNHATNPLFSFMPAATVSSINTTGTLALDVVARWGAAGNTITSDIHYANYIN